MLAASIAITTSPTSVILIHSSPHSPHVSHFYAFADAIPSSGASLVAQTVKNLPAMQKTWVRSGRPPPEKGMAAHSSILAWRIPRTEEPGRLQ